MTEESSTLDDILQKAIDGEIEAQEFYRTISRLVQPGPARDELLGLVAYEKEHQAKLEKYRRGEISEGALGMGQPVDWKISGGLNQPAMTPDMGLKDVFLLAARREKASREFYTDLAGLHPPGQVRNMFERLAAEEAQHKSRVEFLYTEVAFPQTDGG